MTQPYRTATPPPPSDMRDVLEAIRLQLSIALSHNQRGFGVPRSLTAEQLHERIRDACTGNGVSSIYHRGIIATPTLEEVRAAMVILVETNPLYDWYSPREGHASSFADDEPRIQKRSTW